MTNQEKLARLWAEGYQKNYPEFLPESHANEMVKRAKAAADYIMEHTTPPTMEGVEWEHELHHFAGATADTGEDVVMVDPHGPGITVIDLDTEEVVAASPLAITPNGKRYELVDVTDEPEPGPEHPKWLRTVEDYEDAPNSTIVAIQGFHTVWVKDKGTWSDGEDYTETSDYMAGEPREVLRWGRGE